MLQLAKPKQGGAWGHDVSSTSIEPPVELRIFRNSVEAAESRISLRDITTISRSELQQVKLAARNLKKL